MAESATPNRCRIVLVTPPAADAADLIGRLEAAVAGGDVASVILPQAGLDEAAFQAFAERVVPLVQARGIAAMIAGDSRIAGRVGADGIHVEGSRAELAEAVKKHQPKFMVGAGGARTRHGALELGDERPDYMFFGRFGHDTKPEPHRRNLALGTWWSALIEIPCIVLAGAALESVATVAGCGAEFVALGDAVFSPGLDPGRQVAEANALLDRDAPRFDG